MIGTRTLKVSLPTGEQDVPVTPFEPEAARTTWRCRYEIGWPEGPKSFHATGFDALQAVHLAMQMIGAELYTSAYHQQGRLRWGKAGEGYGFPLTPSLLHLLIGDDKRFDG